MSVLLQRLIDAHQGRDPERLRLKYEAMAQNACAFHRGTPFLFYDALQERQFAMESPLAWICGDAHLENFGVYKGDNRLVYFDCNDFDESAIAPCSWDVLRMLASMLLREDQGELTEVFLDAYGAALASGKAQWIERATARGQVRDLMRGLKGQKRVTMLEKRTQVRKGKRRLLVDGKYALPVADVTKTALGEFIGSFGAGRGLEGFFHLHDAARRIAGNSSLGVERYVLLVEGKGSPDGNYLLDMKQARPSAAARLAPGQQRDWGDEARRICGMQRQMQAVPPAFLEALQFQGESYVLRELMPREDRVRLEKLNEEAKALPGLVASEARVLAWAQLRSSGRRGAGSADELMAFGADLAWRTAALDWARNFAASLRRDWEEFRQADLSELVAGKAGVVPVTKSVRRRR